MPSPTLIVGAPCWIDLYSSDTDKATAFYGDLFGWTAQPPEEGFGGYFIFTKDGKASPAACTTTARWATRTRGGCIS